MSRKGRPGGWSALEPKAGQRGAAQDLAADFARCFSTPAGRRVLEYLERAFLARRVPPTASDALLRHVEGQRSVVAHVRSLIEQGLSARRS